MAETAHEPEEEPDGDELIKAFIAGKWREATDASKEAMDALRSLYPDLTTHLSEMGVMHVESALNKVTAAYGDLNQLGRYALGDEDYKTYLDEQARRRIDT